MHTRGGLKSRLVDPEHLTMAVQQLMKRGVPEELVPVHLARAFYVDMDELNAVLEMVRSSRREQAAAQTEHVA